MSKHTVCYSKGCWICYSLNLALPKAVVTLVIHVEANQTLLSKKSNIPVFKDSKFLNLQNHNLYVDSDFPSFKVSGCVFSSAFDTA